jgi:hypothetical protein
MCVYTPNFLSYVDTPNYVDTFNSTRINNFYCSNEHRVKRFAFDNEAVFRSVQKCIDYAECAYTPTDLHNKPYARPFRFEQAGLSHTKRADSPDIRAEWCMFLNSDVFNPKGVRVYVPEYRSVVSRKKFRATEGYPDSWNYEKRPLILPIPREEKGLEFHEEEKEPVPESIDDAVEEERFTSPHVDENRHQMVLRSHTRANKHMSVTEQQCGLYGNSEDTEGTANGFIGERSAAPSDRDFYEYMPAFL